MNSRARQLGRRRFLRGAGGIALALPWLERFDPLRSTAQAQAAGGPRRIIAVTYDMGIAGGQWRPSGNGSSGSFTLPYTTAPLTPMQDRCLFVSAIDNRVLGTGGNSYIFGHPGKKEASLTGTLTTGAFPASNTNHVDEVMEVGEVTGSANGPSVEQLVGAHLMRTDHARPAVNLGVDGNKTSPYSSPDQQDSAYFFESAANPVTLEMNPSRAFMDLFTGLMPGAPPEVDEAALRLRARNKSVLDAVRDSFRELSGGLGRQDRMRLDEHAARIRQLELDVQVAASCSVPTGIDTSVTDYMGVHMGELAPLMNRILAHAMACDLAPIGRLEYANQQNPRFGIPSLDDTLNGAMMYDWHGMVHGDALPGTTTFLRPGRDDGVTTYDARLLDGYRFFVQQFAALLSELDAIPEGPDTSVLDNSLVVLASDLGEGMGHGHMKMGYVLAGNLGGARTGYHFDAGPSGQPYEPSGAYFYTDSSYDVSQLLNSILDMAGVVDGGGDPVNMGLQGYLESRSAPRRIDGLFT